MKTGQHTYGNEYKACIYYGGEVTYGHTGRTLWPQ